MSFHDLDDAQISAARKIEKLLKLAAKGGTEAEMASATAKAQQMLAEYNLTLDVVNQGVGDDGRREEGKIKGGLYHFQRDLWNNVAVLNFCLYWNLYTPVVKKYRTKGFDGQMIERSRNGYVFEHQVVGRRVNVVGTKMMAQYLEQTIERMARERAGSPAEFFTKWATSYREGLANAVIKKIQDERRRVLREESKRAEEAAAAFARAEGAGASSSTTLAISSLVKSEYDANIDFVYGDGTSARWAAERAEAARERKERDEAHARWAKENPEEAKAAEEERRKSARRASYGRQTYADKKWNKRDHSAFDLGAKDGEKISLHRQADQHVPRKLG